MDCPILMYVARTVFTCTQVGKVKICDAIGNWKIGNRASDLFNAIRRHQLVHWFDLQGCMLGSDRVRKGLEALQSVKALDTLDLQDNLIDRSCLTAIQDFLSFSNVRELYLQGNPLQPTDFDELEKLVTKLGRECTVYCYKNKDQPTRKLICSTVRQASGVDESLSFSSEQLNGIFQKYRDRDAFLQTAAAAEEIAYTRASRKVCETLQDVPVVVGTTVAEVVTIAEVAEVDAAQPAPEGGSVPAQAAADDFDTNEYPQAAASCAADGLDRASRLTPEIPLNSGARARPHPSTSMRSVPEPSASKLSDVDTIVAMGFDRCAVEAAYTKSGRDLQVCCEIAFAVPNV
jgi:hypothetical protein